jgi:hypothetical protein
MRKKQPKLLDWDKGIEDDIAFLAGHDPKALNFALNHVPPSNLRRQWVMFDAKLGRLRQRAETDDEAKKELARVIALFLQTLQPGKGSRS